MPGSIRLEGPAGHEAGLEVAVGPLDEALGFGVAGLADDDTHAERSPEPLERLGQVRPTVVARHQRRLVVIDAAARHTTEIEEAPEVPAEDVMGLARRDHPRRDHRE